MHRFVTFCAALWVLFGVIPILDAHPALKRLCYGPDWVYQSIYVNGEEVYHSNNASGGSHIIQSRYEAIKKVLDQYDRPFTVLDLGANNGYFSLKIAEDYDTVCVMVDRSERLADICALNTERNKIIYLQKDFKKNDIWELVRSEHFDVILALLVLHHVDDWRSWVDGLLQLGDNVIIEIPPVDDPINKNPKTKELATYLTKQPQAVEIGRFLRGEGIYDHMLWFCQNSISTLRQKGRQGILPETFSKLSGAFPRRSFVEEMHQKIIKQYGTDKWILQGIDFTLESP